MSLCNRWKPVQKPTTNKKAELGISIPMDTFTTQLLHLRLRDQCGRRSGKTLRAREPGSLLRLCVLVSSEAVPLRSHQHNCINTSWTRTTTIALLKWMGQGEPGRPQSYPENHRHPRNAESGRNHLPQGRAHRLVIQYLKVIPENVHTSDIILTEQITLMYAAVYMYMPIHICIWPQLMRKEAMSLRDS